ncbi:DivIVA domain-containing protein [Telluribacter sp. SYSU D00476]|uniref:DivIVA domain-containing protein n=1 Tax=Telluribacter sp. SYSU D00476 TaxID=2811430 RepID=UPI001FF2FC1E|nr:DivIVA domain-containing protein [Telluribacter sp. SYSU D00476]
MKISPIDIRQHTFEKGFRGYDVDEVSAFLNSLSQEWERVTNENKMLKMQLEIAEKELNKLRDVELTLFRTLKTAEDTSTQITEQANKAAEKYLQESRLKSDEVINEAKRKASMLIQDAENQSRYIKEELVNELKNQERDFKAIEKYRDNLIVQLKTLVNSTNDTVDRFEKKFSKDSYQTRIDDLKQQIAETGKNRGIEDQNIQTEAGVEEAVVAQVEETPAPSLDDTTATTTIVDTPVEVVEVTEEAPAEEVVAEEVAVEEVAPAPVEEVKAEVVTDTEVAEPQVEKTTQEDASVAMAEAEQVAETSQQASGALKQNRNPEPVEEKKSGGSFFDQIG